MDKIKIQSQVFFSLFLFLSYAGSAEAFLSNCRYSYDIQLYTDLCTEELEREWRPKLNPNSQCAKLIIAAEEFDRHFDNGDVEINERCTREELMGIAASAAVVLSKAREKGWTTFEKYMSYEK